MPAAPVTPTTPVRRVRGTPRSADNAGHAERRRRYRTRPHRYAKRCGRDLAWEPVGLESRSLHQAGLWGRFRSEGSWEVRLRVRTKSGVKVPIGQKHWSVRSGRQLRRRETGWGAAGSERAVHKHNNAELDSA